MKHSRFIPVMYLILIVALGARVGRAVEGPYAGIDLGGSEPWNDNYRSHVETGGTAAPFVGMMFGEYVGLHSQFHALFYPPDANDDRPQAGLDHRNQWTTVLGLDVGPRLSLPLGRALRLYTISEGGAFKGLGGRLNQWAPGFTLGGGIDYNVTSTFAVGLFARWNRIYMAPHPTTLAGHVDNDQGPKDARFTTAGLRLTYFYGPQPEPPPPPAPPPPQAPPPPLPTAAAPPPPQTGEAPGVPVPPPAKVKIVLRSVHFDFGQARIRADAKPVLDEAVHMLKDSGAQAIIVSGHTDAKGSDAYNMRLSLQRAEAVYTYLVDHGIEPRRIRAQGFGKTQPVASNDTEDGRAQNRRVELDLE